MPPRRFRAPTADGEVLAAPNFGAVPALVEANRRLLDRSDVVIGGLPLRELRALARREVLEATQSPPVATGGLSVDAPLLLAGHQPELSHPGVWVKNFALSGLARKLGGTPLHLIVDNDTLKSASLRFPVLAGLGPKAHIESVPFDRAVKGLPYEYATVQDESLFRSFGDRAHRLTEHWSFTPLVGSVWPRVVADPTPWIGERFVSARCRLEREWEGGNNELPVNRLSESQSFGRFVRHLLEDGPRFAAVYNTAVRRYRSANGIRSKNHPVPDLSRQDGWVESPFWAQHYGGYFHARRGRLFGNGGAEARVDSGQGVPVAEAVRTFRIRPRALTLTLFARVCLGDFFIHGIGGGKYDEVTDAIIRDYFGIEPPAYQVLSATLHLPLPGFSSTEEDVKRGERLARDLHWNPQRHLTPESLALPEVQSLVAEKEFLAAGEPPYADHTARREWYRRLHDLTERLRPFVAGQLCDAEAKLAHTRVEARANAVLKRRDYSWVLYPEETLRPFFQRFLEV